jgi:hypothetical protein
MKAIIIRKLNEIVSLTILALMSTALIAGQADAVAHAAAPEMIHAEFAIDLRLGEIARLNVDRESIEVIRKILDTRLERND